MRYQLTACEIDRFKLLGQDAGEAIGTMARNLRPGLSERQVARRAVDSLAAIDSTAVVTLVAADERLPLYRHPVPTDLCWRKILMIVVCARRNGLIASLTRIVCEGEVPEVLRERTEGTAVVMGRLLNYTRPGVSGADLYAVAASAYHQLGFDGEEHLHHQGGATGYRTRDWVAHPASKEKVLARQAFAWNPSITGSKVEETCISTDNGVEIITSSPGWPSIPVRINDAEYFLPGVLSL
jgi:Xaa-Pro aminopeptidase